jgi:hypothetical protein
MSEQHNLELKEKARRYVKEKRWDYLLANAYLETKYFTSWSKRDDFEEQWNIGLTNISSEIRTLECGYKKMKNPIKTKTLLIILTVLLSSTLVACDNNHSRPSSESQERPSESQERLTASAQNLTNPQQNAMRAAKQYLSFYGFSREGLIDQLSSQAGNGFDVNDATITVDSLEVDWNEQAVIAAKHYLQFSGFSCAGLIQQLSARAGGKFTETQADYGARKAGAC